MLAPDKRYRRSGYWPELYRFPDLPGPELCHNEGRLLPVRLRRLGKLSTIGHKFHTKSAIHLSVKSTLHQDQNQRL
jgi:hypothetical protein